MLPKWNDLKDLWIFRALYNVIVPTVVAIMHGHANTIPKSISERSKISGR